MNTMKWLVKREYWEHKGGFFWAPIWVGAIMTLMLAIVLSSALIMGNKHIVEVNGTTVTTTHAIGDEMTVDEKHDVVNGLASGYMGLSLPMFAVLGVVTFFFCLGALFDERKDRSVLFWKSLPVSDTATVASKVALALVVAPVITLVIGTATSLLWVLMMMITASLSGVHGIGQVFTFSSFYLAPLQLAGMLPVYMLWALPTVGWLMMVSAWANTKPFLWAVGVPLIAVMLLSLFNQLFGFGWNVNWFNQHIVGRGLTSLVPGSWFMRHHELVSADEVSMAVHGHAVDMGLLLKGSWRALATADMWIGVLAGIGMLAVAVRLRRWRDEG